MKQIKDLGEKEVILCVTLDECEAIAELLDKENELWLDGSGYKEYKPWQTLYVGKFCFHPYLNEYSSLEYWESKNSTIHHAKDFFPPQKYYTPQEVKVITNALIDDIIKEYHESKFQKNLLTILRERLK